MDEHNRYVSSLSTRYASDEMQFLFSSNHKFRLWRELWIALARAEQSLGLSISDAQIAEMEAVKEDINYEVAEAREREVRHDVMSHVYAFGKQAPSAAPIIHLGATSCYVTDNTDLIILREAAQIIQQKAAQVLSNLATFAETYKDVPALAYTHLQPAQLTTLGKRATLWMNELVMDMERLAFEIDHLALRGAKGTTGSQASFLELFDGDADKVRALDAKIAEAFGFAHTIPVTGQTYSRKIDSAFLNVLSGIAQSASKFANDLRLLQSFEEMEEPFQKDQIGSSAMPYKRNPMRAERMCALARYVMVDALNPAITASVQWMERTLDDSANKRLAVSEAFLATDAILNLYMNITEDLTVYEHVVRRRVMAKLPFMATENIMMESVKRGANRQDIHEIIRVHSHAAARAVKEGGENDLIQRLADDPRIPLSEDEIRSHLDPSLYTGLAPQQVDAFLADVARPLIERTLVDHKTATLRV